MESNPALAVEANTTSRSSPQWVVFRCGQRKLVTPLSDVREIVPPLPFTRIPGCGPAVCGLVGVRARAVTVFDLAAVLGLAPIVASSDHRLVLLERGERLVGFAVDEVLAVVSAPAERSDDIAPLRLEPGEHVGSCRVGRDHCLAIKLDRIVGRLLA